MPDRLLDWLFEWTIRKTLITCVVVAVVGVAIGIPTFTSYSTTRSDIVTICNKEAVATKSGHEYRVYTSNGTFVVKDHIVNGSRFNSADVYGKLASGKTYNLTYYGWRNGFFSAFENIIDATPSTEMPTGSCVL